VERETGLEVLQVDATLASSILSFKAKNQFNSRNFLKKIYSLGEKFLLSTPIPLFGV
jgi:hypothetical protein